MKISQQGSIMKNMERKKVWRHARRCIDLNRLTIINSLIHEDYCYEEL